MNSNAGAMDKAFRQDADAQEQKQNCVYAQEQAEYDAQNRVAVAYAIEARHHGDVSDPARAVIDAWRAQSVRQQSDMLNDARNQKQSKADAVLARDFDDQARAQQNELDWFKRRVALFAAFSAAPPAAPPASPPVAHPAYAAPPVAPPAPPASAAPPAAPPTSPPASPITVSLALARARAFALLQQALMHARKNKRFILILFLLRSRVGVDIATILTIIRRNVRSTLVPFIKLLRMV
jgi:hypothetical protein